MCGRARNNPDTSDSYNSADTCNGNPQTIPRDTSHTEGDGALQQK